MKNVINKKEETKLPQCQDCGGRYKVDVLVPDELWEEIKPYGKLQGAGLLCGERIFERIENRNQYGAFKLSLSYVKEV